MRKLLVVAFALLTACVGVNTTKLNPTAHYDQVPADSVYIFQSEDEVPKPYVKLLLFHASGSSMYTDEADLYQKMREEAAKNGCNGVILQGEEDAGTAEKIFFGAGASREAKAVCIRYGEAVKDGTEDSQEEGGGSTDSLPVVQL